MSASLSPPMPEEPVPSVESEVASSPGECPMPVDDEAVSPPAVESKDALQWFLTTHNALAPGNTFIGVDKLYETIPLTMEDANPVRVLNVSKNERYSVLLKTDRRPDIEYYVFDKPDKKGEEPESMRVIKPGRIVELEHGKHVLRICKGPVTMDLIPWRKPLWRSAVLKAGFETYTVELLAEVGREVGRMDFSKKALLCTRVSATMFKILIVHDDHMVIEITTKRFKCLLNDDTVHGHGDVMTVKREDTLEFFGAVKGADGVAKFPEKLVSGTAFMTIKPVYGETDDGEISVMNLDSDEELPEGGGENDEEELESNCDSYSSGGEHIDPNSDDDSFIDDKEDIVDGKPENEAEGQLMGLFEEAVLPFYCASYDIKGVIEDTEDQDSAKLKDADIVNYCYEEEGLASEERMSAVIGKIKNPILKEEVEFHERFSYTSVEWKKLNLKVKAMRQENLRRKEELENQRLLATAAIEGGGGEASRVEETKPVAKGEDSCNPRPKKAARVVVPTVVSPEAKKD